MLALGCTLLFTAFWPVLAWLAGRMAKSIGAGDLQAIATLAGIAAVVFLVRGVAQYGQDTLMAKAALNIALNLRNLAFSHLQGLSLDYFEKAKTGDLSYRLTEDVDRVGEVIRKLFHDFVPCVLQLIVVFGFLFYVNWQLTLAVSTIVPLMAVLIGAFGEQLLKFSRRSQQRISNLSSLLTEGLGGIRLVQAFAAQDYQIQRFRQEAHYHWRSQYLTERTKALQFVIVGFLQAIGIILLFFLAGWQISLKNLTGVDFVSYLAAIAMLTDPITHLTDNYNLFKQGQASADRLWELLAIQPTVQEKPNAIALPSVTGRVEYRQVSFAYSTEQLVLKKINFVASPGETIALVGASGAGKTTLINLLPRFYDPIEGEILIDGFNIQDVTLSSLRQQIALVLQDNILLSGTIAENIAFGQNHFDLKEIERAAKIANAHAFIQDSPQGYSTYVGERGVNLSGGQKQRIAIARAVLRDPKILILDEATSALDLESEALIQEALERLTYQRTVFIIAHRLATVRRANRIFVLENGQMIESGTHQELLNKNGHYARFHSQQFSQNR